MNSSTAKFIITISFFLAVIASGPQANAQLLPHFSDFSNHSYQGLKVIPSVKAGYQRMGINFNMPAVIPVGSLLIGSPFASNSTVDLVMRDVNLWVGAARIDVITSGALSMYLSAEGSLRKNIIVATNENPMAGNIGVNQPVQWAGSQLEYWAIDGGIGLQLRSAKILLGLRRDKLSVNLRDPFGYSNPFPPVPPPAVLGLTVTGSYGDFTQSLWIPYFGFEVVGANYRWNLIGTPFMAAEINVPLTATTNFMSGGIFFGQFSGYIQDRSVTWKYSITQPSVFVETNFDYDLRLASNFDLGGWFKATYMHVRGSGDLDASTMVSDYFVHPFGQPAPFEGVRTQSATSSDGNTVTYGRYDLAVGLSAQLRF